MTKKFTDLKSKMTAKDRVEVEKRVTEILAAMPFDKIRKAHNMTQVAMAEKRPVDQATVNEDHWLNLEVAV